MLLLLRDALFVLFGLLVNGIRCFDVERDGLPRQGLHEDLHASAEHPSEYETLLIRWDALFVLRKNGHGSYNMQ